METAENPDLRPFETSHDENQPSSELMAIEGPDYFAGLDLAALILTVSQFTIDTHCQYSRQSHHNRAKLRTPDGAQWITVPIEGGQYARPVRDVIIDYDQNWVGKHLKAFRFNYASTPFYEHYIPEIENLLTSRPETLGVLTEASVHLIHRFLGCTCRLHTIDHYQHGQKEQEGPSSPGTRSSDLAPGSIVRRAGLEGRFSVTDSESSYDTIIKIEPEEYRQNFLGFIGGLSTLDLLFNHGPDARGILKRAITIVE